MEEKGAQQDCGKKARAEKDSDLGSNMKVEETRVQEVHDLGSNQRVDLNFGCYCLGAQGSTTACTWCSLFFVFHYNLGLSDISL